ncbi:hypothetical protein IFM89_035662 [Coptis chinensis]|uniref:PORR domain-containing protein n=1 Tax=Coptis chinensis TaxID=261450 RepID=A0A835HLQ1_9MAGN|nr:hypothetical protein IFM89_035662 [Coptis chinensis]
MKRELGFLDDFLCNLGPKHSDYFQLLGCSGEEKSLLELVIWDEEFEESVIKRSAEEETRLTEQSSSEMEKSIVGVLHEFLSMSLLKRMPVPIIGKLKDEYRFSNAFVNPFLVHQLGTSNFSFFLHWKGSNCAFVTPIVVYSSDSVNKDSINMSFIDFDISSDSGLRIRHVNCQNDQCNEVLCKNVKL